MRLPLQQNVDLDHKKHPGITLELDIEKSNNIHHTALLALYLFNRKRHCVH